jgi:hypothetical protein
VRSFSWRLATDLISPLNRFNSKDMNLFIKTIGQQIFRDFKIVSRLKVKPELC